MIIQFYLYILLIFNSLLFIILSHPLSMGLILMMQTFLIALFTGSFSLMYWFSYSLFLIFMGGMLILFMYMTSLASNEIFKFSMNFKLMLFILLMMMISIFMILFLDFKSILTNNKLFNMETKSLYYFLNMMEQNNWMLNKMFNFPTNFITLLLVNYLFLTLVAVVKITNIFKGPLRSKIS